MEHWALLPAGGRQGDGVAATVAQVEEESAPMMVNVTVPVGVAVSCVTVAVKTIGAPV